MTAPLIIAAHGTRLAEGQQACRELVALVADMLPTVDVRGAYVELDEPTIADAVESALAADEKRAVVVPLMVGAGGHVLDDIPTAGEEGRRRVPGSHVSYSAHLGPEPAMRAAVLQRIDAVLGDWEPSEVGVVFLGRGCSVTEANADHARLTRQIGEEGGYGCCVSAFIQVVRPTLTDGLNQALAMGFTKIVVSPNFLFPGRLHRWAGREIDAWVAEHPGVDVRLADVIGPCEELASVVVERYRQAAVAEPGAGSPVYLAGLSLRGRRVVVVGAGVVATRRIERLLESGADVAVVAPEASELIASLSREGRLTWHQRGFVESDLADAWYVLAVTDRPEVNALVASAADAQHTFCVRGDDAFGGTAWTPASGTIDGLTVGVIGNRTPRRSAGARDAALAAVADFTKG